MKKPMVRLDRNLYGHPLAGLLWEKMCHTAILSEGFTKLQGWECLFVHTELKLWLSVYVDDFRMAGIKENLAPMWERLSKRLALEPAIKSSANTYLGCNQRVVHVNPVLIEEKAKLFDKLMGKESDMTREKILQQNTPISFHEK